MRTLVTGATGLVGNAVVRRLIHAGHEVRALVRSPERARPLLPASVQCVEGDVTVPGSLPEALEGQELVVHAAGIPEKWLRDPGAFDRVNRAGTSNVLRAAHACGVGRVVHVSTMDVFAGPPGSVLDERCLVETPSDSPYARSKQLAEREALAVMAEGLEVVFVNPSAIYGPSPVDDVTNAFIRKLLDGALPLLPPGGLSVVYVDVVAEACLAAVVRGRPGQRYLLADAHVSCAAFAREVLRWVPGARVPATSPKWLMSWTVLATEPLGRLLGVPPLMTGAQLHHVLQDYRVDATQAARELGIEPFPLAEGVRRTVEFLREQGRVRR